MNDQQFISITGTQGSKQIPVDCWVVGVLLTASFAVLVNTAGDYYGQAFVSLAPSDTDGEYAMAALRFALHQSSATPNYGLNDAIFVPTRVRLARGRAVYVIEDQTANANVTAHAIVLFEPVE